MTADPKNTAPVDPPKCRFNHCDGSGIVPVHAGDRSCKEGECRNCPEQSPCVCEMTPAPVDQTTEPQVGHGVIYATVRDAVEPDGTEVLHIECRFANGEKSAPIVIDGVYDALADSIAKFLSDAQVERSIDYEKVRRIVKEIEQAIVCADDDGEHGCVNLREWADELASLIPAKDGE
jgi:hypothetical protein